MLGAEVYSVQLFTMRHDDGMYFRRGSFTMRRLRAIACLIGYQYKIAAMDCMFEACFHVLTSQPIRWRKPSQAPPLHVLSASSSPPCLAAARGSTMEQAA